MHASRALPRRIGHPRWWTAVALGACLGCARAVMAMQQGEGVVVPANAAPAPAAAAVAPTPTQAERTEAAVVMTGTAGEAEPLINEHRLPLLAWIVGIAAATTIFVARSRRGKPPTIRRIAALEAVDEAIGRATEMGRPVLFIPGIQDMDNIQTVAGITMLGRVSRTAAEYDSVVEAPVCRSLVMEAAREAVQASCLAAGRADAYQPDRINYITDEQFGYVAYVGGKMMREKPAACFYMGCFFAESLIFSETGNAIGAIQIAGTAESSQLPFFVAACDYTLIGEEFFAASAYLSGEPDQLGTLQAQDSGKVAVITFVLLGTAVATVAALAPSAAGLAALSALLQKAMGG